MLEKINTQEIKENVTNGAKHLSVAVMTGAMAIVAAEVGGIHPPKADLSKEHKDRHRIVVPAPTETHAPGGGHGAAEARARHTEEVGPHHTSYGSMQRTPARSGGI